VVLVKYFYNTHVQCYTAVQPRCALVLQIKPFGMRAWLQLRGLMPGYSPMRRGRIRMLSLGKDAAWVWR